VSVGLHSHLEFEFASELIELLAEFIFLWPMGRES
jgi:hypothetical protein